MATYAIRRHTDTVLTFALTFFRCLAASWTFICWYEPTSIASQTVVDVLDFAAAAFAFYVKRWWFAVVFRYTAVVAWVGKDTVVVFVTGRVPFFFGVFWVLFVQTADQGCYFFTELADQCFVC